VKTFKDEWEYAFRDLEEYKQIIDWYQSQAELHEGYTLPDVIKDALNELER
jgi:hypothetical protein